MGPRNGSQRLGSVPFNGSVGGAVGPGDVSGDGLLVSSPSSSVIFKPGTMVFTPNGDSVGEKEVEFSEPVKSSVTLLSLWGAIVGANDVLLNKSVLGDAVSFAFSVSFSWSVGEVVFRDEGDCVGEVVLV